MKQFFRITAALLAAAFLLALTGCGSSSSAPSFTWFVDTIPANLDPQVASAAPDVIACENLYSGLVRKKADGEIVPDLSESWTVSSDGRTYTFQIKDGLTYKAVKGASTDHTITAEDFVFAFRRIFQPQTNSPYAVEFAALENLCAANDLLILDEPVTGLDPASMQDLYKTLRYLNEREGMAIIMVTHDIENALREAKHILCVDRAGCFYGTVSEFLSSPAGKRFGGERA